MKNLKTTTIILLIGIMSSCTKTSEKNQGANVESPEISNFDWLLGDWVRLHEEQGLKTYEQWEKNNENSYSGIGFTMRGADTVQQEKIYLTRENQSWKLEVKIPQEPEKIKFTMIEQTEASFTCENKRNDFPKRIKYWVSGEGINASVWNDEMKIDFEFVQASKN